MHGETAVQWDLRTMVAYSSGLSQIFFLYIIAFFFIGCWKIAKAWRMLAQFAGHDGDYAHEWDKIANSADKWTKLTFLIWGLYLCLLTARTCADWISLSAHYISVWPSIIHEMAILTTTMLLTTTILFLGRWYVQRRASSLTRPGRN